MGWPESVTYLMLIALGYALTRVVDLAVDWQRRRQHAGEAGAPELSASGRQRLLERRAVYTRFRTGVEKVAGTSVQDGHGSYGLLYQVRDDYGDLLRQAPPGVVQAADSVIRCITLLVNLGPSDQRFAMYTRALAHYDEECAADQGGRSAPFQPRLREFAVLADDTTVDSDLPAAATTSAPSAPRTGSGSASARAPT